MHLHLQNIFCFFPEKDLDPELEAVTFITASPSSAADLITQPSPSVLASRVPTRPQTTVPDPTFSPGSHHMDKQGSEIISAVTQLWESSISRQEGSTSLENGDTLNMENEEKPLHTTTYIDQTVSIVGLVTTESPESLNTSHSPTEFPTVQYQTSNYGVYLDTLTTSYEETSGYEPETVNSTLQEDNEEKMIVSLITEEEVNVSLSQEKEVKVAPTSFFGEESKVATITEKVVNVVPTHEEDPKVSPTSVTEEEANVVTATDLEEEAKVDPTLFHEEGAKMTPTPAPEEEVKVAPTITLEEEVKVQPTLVLEEENISPTFDHTEEPVLEGGAKVDPTSDYEEETTGDLLASFEGEDKTTPTLDFEEEANATLPVVQEREAKFAPTLMTEEVKLGPTLVAEKEVNVAPTIDDFTVSPITSQTSEWALLTTTTGHTVSLKDVEFGQKATPAAASDSYMSTKSTAATKPISTTTTTTTTTRWSRHTWSPKTTTPKFVHKTTEPHKVIRVIPPVDHHQVETEISLTQPPTLLILPNERAAVGGTGKSSGNGKDILISLTVLFLLNTMMH